MYMYVFFQVMLSNTNNSCHMQEVTVICQIFLQRVCFHRFLVGLPDSFIFSCAFVKLEPYVLGDATVVLHFLHLMMMAFTGFHGTHNILENSCP